MSIMLGNAKAKNRNGSPCPFVSRRSIVAIPTDDDDDEEERKEGGKNQTAFSNSKSVFQTRRNKRRLVKINKLDSYRIPILHMENIMCNNS